MGAAFDAAIQSLLADVCASPRAASGQRRGGATASNAPLWWDAELAGARRSARRAIRSDRMSHAARTARADFQRLLRRKRASFRHATAINLAKLAQDNPARFWIKFKTPKSRVCRVPNDRLLQHFQVLLGQPPPPHAATATSPSGSALPETPAACTTDRPPPDHTFTAASVAEGIRSLHGGKATIGILRLDALSSADAELSPCIAALFGACQRVGWLPHSWALCSITPIHKGGDAEVPGNYRGIAVGSLLAKLYASILNSRLSPWTENHNTRARGQAGFRSNHRTTDQLFVMRTLVEQARKEKRPLYTCFVDFQKAYDTVPRDLLWSKLQRIGIGDEFLRAVQALYADVPVCVQLTDGTSPSFPSLLGVKQGCPLSPTLFGMYIDDFETELAAGADAFDLPSLAGVPTPALFYADDLALVSLSPAGLQAQLRLLEAYSLRWRLTVNVAKTKAVVFAAPAQQCALPKLRLTYADSPVEVVDSFRYLGLDLYSTRRFAAASETRVAAAKRAALALHHRCSDLPLHDPVIRAHLFDALVVSVLLYGVELWGPGVLCSATGMEACERVQREALRNILGVRESTPGHVLLGECGRFPLAHTAILAVCKMWNRLVALPDSRLVKQAFLENVGLAVDAQPNGAAFNMCWVSQVVKLLHPLPVLVDGMPQHIDIDALLAWQQRQFFESVSASDMVKVQDWVDIVGPEHLSCTTFAMAAYLQEVPSRAGRRRLAQLRTGSHWLRIETGRWSHEPRERRTCKRCDTGVVDSLGHMIFGCPALEEQRQQQLDLFASGMQSPAEFLQQDSIELALFALRCAERCKELEDL